MVKNEYMNICNHCTYRKQSGGVLNRYGLGRCLAYYCNNPKMEIISHRIYENIRQDGDEREWDVINDE